MTDEPSPDEEAHLHGYSLLVNIGMLQVLIITEESSLERLVAISYHVDIEHGDEEDGQAGDLHDWLGHNPEGGGGGGHRQAFANYIVLYSLLVKV